MKKIPFDVSAPEFRYAEAMTADLQGFPALLKLPEVLSYPRPLLLVVKFSLAKPRAQSVDKFIEMAVREYGSLVYAQEGQYLYILTPNGAAKGENAFKTRRLIALFGDIKAKKPCTADAVLAYVSEENADRIFADAKAKIEETQGVAILDDLTVDPANPNFLSGKESGDLAYDIAYSLGFNGVGVARIVSERNRVEILSTHGKESFSRLGKSFSLERVLPFVSLSSGDDFFFVADSRNLPPKPMAILDSIGVISITMRFFKEEGKLIGFAYATSTRNVGYMKKDGFASLERFYALAEKRFLLQTIETERQEAYQTANDLSSYSDNALLRVDRKGNIVYMSPNLAKAYASREARINDKASKPFPMLFGKKPVQTGDDITLSQLGAGTYRFYLLSSDDEGTKTYLFTRLEETLGTRRKEKDTDIFTMASYRTILQDELLERHHGALLYLRLSNAEAVAAKMKPAAKTKEVMDAFISFLVEKNYGYDLYRYDETTLVYLLPRISKEAGKSLALSLATLLSKVTKLGRFMMIPQVDYLLLTYPIEVAYTTDADSFVRSLLGKAADFGHGRLSELNKERGRLLLPPAYEEEAVKKAMVAQEVPFRLTPVKDITTNKVAFLHLDLNIHGEDGDEILPPNVISAATRTNLLVKMMGLAQEKIALSYLDDTKTMKSLGYEGIMFHIPMSLLVQEGYYANFLKAVPANHSFLYLRFGESEVNEKTIHRLDALKKEGFKLVLEDYRHHVDYDFDGYATSLFDLTGGRDDNGASFLTLCQKHARAGKVVAVGFVDDPQAIAFLSSSHLSFAMGQAAGKAMIEKDFLTTLRNKRKQNRAK